MRIALLLLASLALAACAAPDAIVIEAAHTSHLSQHEPLTEDPTRYGVDSLGLLVKWHRGQFTVEAGEAYNFANPAMGFLGPRELFEARAAYEIPLRP